MAKCPHCKGEVVLSSAEQGDSNKVHKEVVGIIKKEAMYSCPYCNCVLGFAFFFGGMITGRP